jgi:hypothetical protein
MKTRLAIEDGLKQIHPEWFIKENAKPEDKDIINMIQNKMLER